MLPLLLILIASLSHLISAQWNVAQCEDFITTCDPVAIASCAYSFCQSCTGLGATAIDKCCAANTAPTACLGTISVPQTTAGAVTTAAAILPVACNIVSEFLSICESYTPGFSTLPFSQKAPCLCYSSTSWFPQVYDSYWDACWTSFSVLDPLRYASVTAVDGPIVFNQCQSAGNIYAPVRVTTSSSVAVSAASSVACASLSSIYASCDAQTSGFASLPDLQAVSCLCYTSSTSWIPQLYDGVYGSCMAYLSAYKPAVYATLTAEELGPPVTTFCQSMGNVMAQQRPTTSMPVQSTTMTSPTILQATTTAVTTTQQATDLVVTSLKSGANPVKAQSLVSVLGVTLGLFLLFLMW